MPTDYSTLGDNGQPPRCAKLRALCSARNFIVATVLISFGAVACDGLGAGLVAKGLLENAPGKNSSAFACCTSEACSYKAPYFSFMGEATDPKDITVNEKGICVGPPHKGAICNGTQVPSSANCTSSNLNAMYSELHMTGMAFVYFKINCIAFGLFCFIYMLFFRGNSWHKNGEMNCCMCPEDKEIEMTVGEVVGGSCTACAYCCLSAVPPFACLCKGNKPKLKENTTEALKRCYGNRKAWYWFLTLGGMFSFLYMTTLTSGFQGMTCETLPDGRPSPAQPPICLPGNTYLLVLPDAASWQGPVLVGLFGLVLMAPKSYMTGKVQAMLQNGDGAVEQQVMDRT